MRYLILVIVMIMSLFFSGCKSHYHATYGIHDIKKIFASNSKSELKKKENLEKTSTDNYVDNDNNRVKHEIKEDVDSKYSNLPQYANSIIGASLDNGAMFYGKKIWQDQEFNNEVSSMNYFQAENYCKSLNLLGISEWTLPTREDYIRLLIDKKYQSKRFRYEANRPNMIDPYWTKDEGCYENSIFGVIKRSECVFTVAPDDMYYEDKDTPVIIKKRAMKRPIYKRRKKSEYFVRCVLNPNIYNMIKKENESSALARGGIKGYLSAFMATGNKNNIQKAVSLAKTNNEKAKVEKTLYEYLGALKIFDIKTGNQIISKNAKSSEVNTFLIKNISNKKNLKQEISIKLKRNTPLKLKYNSYKLKVKFGLKLKYCRTMKMGYLSQTLCDTENGYREAVFTLSKNNNYSMSKVIDFGSVDQGGRGTTILFQMDKRLADATIDSEVLSTEVKSYYEK